MSRRNFLKTSALGATALVAGSGRALVASVGSAGLLASTARAADRAPSLQEDADAISRQLFAGDGLARPVPAKPTASDLATGLDRTLVLGGGGEYYVAWYCGFFHGLAEQGLDMNALSEMVVGTSAGAYMGSSLSSGHFTRLRTEFDFFGHFPTLFARLAPVTAPNLSQQRALKVSAAARDGSPATIQTIGRAALAADNKLNGEAVGRLAGLLTGDSSKDWPVSKMFTSAVDCYTGERLIASQAAARRNKIPLAHGAAASSSLPGAIGPTLLGQRYCMDGGICSHAAHMDVVAGCRRALVITVTDGMKPPFLTGVPHPIAQNVKDLEATGTKVLWIVANPPDVNLLDPAQIGPALRTGYERARVESDRIKRFWA
jgi:NTE family protein